MSGSDEVVFDAMVNVVRQQNLQDNYARMSEVIKDAPCDECSYKCKACYNGLQCSAFSHWVGQARFCESWEESWVRYEKYRNIKHTVEPVRGLMVTYHNHDDLPNIVKIGDINKRDA